MDLLDRLIPCFGTCMMTLAFMALWLFGVYSYIEWCNEYERIKALKAEEEVERVGELLDLDKQLEIVRVTARKQKELEELDY